MKLNTKNTGNIGEELAAQWLLQKGFCILARNWRYKHSEVDIIASQKNILHFIEVKTRNSTQFGQPEESINTTKMNALKKAAVAYVEQNTEWKKIQFDVMAITLKPNNNHEFFMIEDVFF